MAVLRTLVACLVGGASAASGRSSDYAVAEAGSSANPIRRVVDLLQKMQQKVEEEGKAEKVLFDKFMCYCKTGQSDLSSSISAAETKGPQVESGLTQSKELKAQLEQDLQKHQSDRAEAKETVASATALREKEAKQFAKDSTDLKTNVAALEKAIVALKKGAMGGFLQTAEGATLRSITVNMDMSSVDRDMLTSFISQGSSQDYAPQSGEIIGVLSTLKDTADKSLADTIAAEKQRVEDFQGLVAAKEKEIEANTNAIESKLERVGQLGVQIVALQQDMKDTEKALLQDKQFLADLSKNCASKQGEWDERSKTRADELVALSDTIKLLNSDEALDLFKEAVPSASLLQLQVSGKAISLKAIQALGSIKGSVKLDLIALALQKRGVNFDHVAKMIDGMVKVLGEEQVADDSKKEYCDKVIDQTEDKHKELDQSVSDLHASIEEGKGALEALTSEIAALEKGIAELDKQVTKATENRKAEHEEYQKAQATDRAAKDLLNLAKNRLAKFYTPKLYKEPPKAELSAQERIAQNMGAFAQSAPSLVQISLHSRRGDAAPAPPPETWDAYQTKGEEHTGVLAMIDLLIQDIDKDLQESEVEEKNSQKDYEQFIKDSASKRTTDSASISQKVANKADLEVEVQRLETQAKSTSKEAMATAEFLASLHGECDWLLQNYAVRKEAREGEAESLKKAKAVLAGADFSLAQTVKVKGLHLRGNKAA